MINLHDLKYCSNLLRKLVASKFVPGNVCNYLNFPKCQNIYRCAYLPIKSAVKSAAILFAADHNYIAKG